LVRMKSPHRPEKEKEKPPRVGMEGRRLFLPFTELTRGSVRTIVDEGVLRIIAVWGNQSDVVLCCSHPSLLAWRPGTARLPSGLRKLLIWTEVHGDGVRNAAYVTAIERNQRVGSAVRGLLAPAKRAKFNRRYHTRQLEPNSGVQILGLYFRYRLSQSRRKSDREYNSLRDILVYINIFLIRIMPVGNNVGIGELMLLFTLAVLKTSTCRSLIALVSCVWTR
jgi:hypothetical protein